MMILAWLCHTLTSVILFNMKVFYQQILQVKHKYDIQLQ